MYWVPCSECTTPAAAAPPELVASPSASKSATEAAAAQTELASARGRSPHQATNARPHPGYPENVMRALLAAPPKKPTDRKYPHQSPRDKRG